MDKNRSKSFVLLNHYRVLVRQSIFHKIEFLQLTFCAIEFLQPSLFQWTSSSRVFPIEFLQSSFCSRLFRIDFQKASFFLYDRFFRSSFCLYTIDFL